VEIFTNVYNWTGTINGSPISGSGETKTDIRTGSIDAIGRISGMDPDYRVQHSGASLYCISCSNSLGGGALKSVSAASIVNFTGGRYSTRRTITHVVNGNIAGTSSIFGQAKLESEDRLMLDVEVLCNFRGPRDISKVSDYVLQLNIGAGRAFGSYVQYLQSPSAQQIINFVECEYLWETGYEKATPLAQQSLGIYFKSITDSDVADDVREVGFSAQGNNVGPIHDVSGEDFVSSLTT
jgi:hypothetical protein